MAFPTIHGIYSEWVSCYKGRVETGDRYFTVEDFKCDEPNDLFICPSGETLRNIGPVKARPGKCMYRFSKAAWVNAD
jgi:hypothetical protein